MKSILGFFDTKDQAMRARDDLLAEGIDSGNINVFSNSSETDFSQSGKSVSNESFMDRIKYFFTHLGEWNIPKEHADLYAEGIRRGGYVLSVQAEDEQTGFISDILDRDGAVDLSRRGEFYKETGYQNYDINARPYDEKQNLDYRNQYQTWEKDRFAGNKEEVIPVIQEDVHVGKRAVERGRVRILTKVTETPINEQVRLREEHINVERRPVNRPINTKDMGAFKEGEIELRETAEEAVVDKEARVVEEVVVRKQADERTETIRDTARKTDVKVDRKAADTRLAEENLKKESLKSTNKI